MLITNQWTSELTISNWTSWYHMTSK